MHRLGSFLDGAPAPFPAASSSAAAPAPPRHPAAGFSPDTGLHWPGFAGPYTTGPIGSPASAARPLFFKFLEVVGELVAASGYLPLEEAGLRAYVHCASYLRVREEGSPADADLVARELRQRQAAETLASVLYAAVLPPRFAELVGLARTLEAWRRKHALPALSYSELAVARGSSGGGSGGGSSSSSGGSSPYRMALHIKRLDAGRAALLEAAQAFPFSALPGWGGVAPRRAPHPGAAAAAAAAAAASAVSPAAAAAAARPAEPIGAPWLFAHCCRYVATSRSAYSAEEVGVSLLEALRTHAEDETALQGALFDALGEGGFALLQAFLEARGALKGLGVAEFRRVAVAMARVGGGGGGGLLGDAPAHRHTARTGAGVTVVLDSELRADKARVKEERKATRALKSGVGGKGLAALEALGFNPDYLLQEASLGLKLGDATLAPLYGVGRERAEAERARAYARAASGGGSAGAGDLVTVEEAIANVGASLSGAQKRALPVGSSDETTEGKREVSVPPATRPEPLDASRLVSIASLEPFAQQAFLGVRTLNRLQSELFEAAYRSNENLLVCAPTGAGKTNVAMLTVCRELSRHLKEDGLSVRGEEFKIVYVAPMKALAQEVVSKFSERLAGLGLRVRELTGDMQLTRREIDETQVIVTTPEKWDVITRKTGEGSLVSMVRLLIIDEVHLLADSRGAVIESLVARTLRLVETSQSVIRIVGLSATLPNYKDVAQFLRVSPTRGLFYFGDGYRPVPLRQTFIGLAPQANRLKGQNILNKTAWDKALAAIRRGKQVMVFVHSRKDTVKTARALLELARADGGGAAGLLSPFDARQAVDGGEEGSSSSSSSSSAAAGGGGGAGPTVHVQGEGRLALTGAGWAAIQRDVEKSRNAELRELFAVGFGIHHAGMLRTDRNLSERLFSAGVTKILCCTATLAWGVNLPAHTVIIKGTQVYDAERADFTDLGILDVMQIFGRAGRPQFDVSGEGIIITELPRLDHYLSLLTASVPIESTFIKALDDHLNAEVVSGTVTCIPEAVTWLKYTYLYVRMVRNPLDYGIKLEEKAADPLLNAKCLDLISASARALDKARMLRFDPRSGILVATDLGRVASHYYLVRETVDRFNELMDSPTKVITDADVLHLVCHAKEFDQVKVRNEELEELDMLRGLVPLAIKGDVTSSVGKTNVLLQATIAGIVPRSFTLMSDSAYISQSAGRITRALFEICLKKGWCSLAERLLTVCKAIDKRMWWTASPLRQFNARFLLPGDVVKKLEESELSLEELLDFKPIDIGCFVGLPKLGNKLAQCIGQVPRLDVEVAIQPITRGVLQLTVSVWAGFEWSERVHGASDPWHLWVEDTANERIYHAEYLVLNRKAAQAGQATVLTFAIPVFEPLPTQYWLRYTSDRWLGCGGCTEISFRHLILPQPVPQHTDLLPLPPLPTTALHSPARAALYRFSHFNPVQTQFFHVLYRTDRSVLLGAPTGSGKTVAAELALFRLFDAHPGKKAVYIAPLKALVAERVKDWRKRLGGLGKRVVELTGDTAPDLASLYAADVIISTPEKWDVVSRGWARKRYVANVGLVIIDEIHLLGEDRGPVLEVIVSRMRHIVAQRGSSSSSDGGSSGIRFVGLSTALANAGDVADWLGVDAVGLYNFRPSVRPVPMEVHVQGFSGKHFCPRQATMNKPTFRAITLYSPTAPALVFVSSRRQTRLTALELIALCAGEDNPRRFLHMKEEEVEAFCHAARDDALKHTLAFGIGIHHAGLCEGDRDIVEELFCSRRIQVLVATSTLAWGVNFPAHLVVVKGTEYFDAKTLRYVDFPVTDVLQMMGRAGRPGLDTQGVAVILTQEAKKTFYKKFLYEPFPVESQLKGAVLAEHLNAEVAGGSITSRHDAVEYLTWTYFFRRLLVNPSYYGLEGTSSAEVRQFLYATVDEALQTLADCGCLLLGGPALESLARAAAGREGEEGEEEGEGGEEGGEAQAMVAAAAAPSAAPTAAPRGHAPASLEGAMQEATTARAAQAEAARLASLEALASTGSATVYTTSASGIKARAAARRAGAAALSEADAQSLPLASDAIAPTVGGIITSTYYLHARTVQGFAAGLGGASGAATAADLRAMLTLLTASPDFAETPVRHNEEELNEGLGMILPAAWQPAAARPQWASPHCKAYLLLAAHMARTPLPIADYANDTKTVLEGAYRLLGALVDTAGDLGCAAAVATCARLSQCLRAGALPLGAGAGGAGAAAGRPGQLRVALSMEGGAHRGAAVLQVALTEPPPLPVAAGARGGGKGARGYWVIVQAAGELVGVRRIMAAAGGGRGGGRGGGPAPAAAHKFLLRAPRGGAMGAAVAVHVQVLSDSVRGEEAEATLAHHFV